jgi:hypothetical protein
MYTFNWAASLSLISGMSSAAAGKAAAGAIAGFAAGAVGTGTLKGAFSGALGGAVLGFAGGVAWQNPVTRLLGHGVAGGVSSTLQGGRFGHGFVSAGVTQAAKPGLTRLGEGPRRAVAEAIVGGTASAATGGKFANGAVTAAMSYAFGQMAQREQDQGRPLTENEIAEAKEAFGDLITDYESVRVFDRKWMPFQGKYVAMAPDGNIYWPAAAHCQDLTQCTITYPGGYERTTLDIFIHEMGHVMQHQQGVNVVLRALPHHVWSGVTFGRYNPYMSRSQFLQTPSPQGLNVEAQADWYMHRYCDRTGNC